MVPHACRVVSRTLHAYESIWKVSYLMMWIMWLCEYMWDVYMIVIILWWYLYTYDNGEKMKMMRTCDFNWWWLFWWTVMKRESYVLDLMITLMMIVSPFIFLRRWLCLFELITWEYGMLVMNMCIEDVKDDDILFDKVKWNNGLCINMPNGKCDICPWVLLC